MKRQFHLLVLALAAVVGSSAHLWAQGQAWEIPSSVKVELVRVVTEDKVTLHGALYWPDPKVYPRPKKAVFVTHGTGGSFYTSVNGFLPPLLAEKGYLSLSLNRRDNGYRYFRSTFEDGVKDLKAGVDYLTSRGAQEVCLMGHSLGSTFVTYYMAMTNDPRVKLLGLSGALHDLRRVTVEFHLQSKEKYDELVSEAKRNVAAGRGSEMFLITLFGRTQAISYHTFLNYRGPDTNAVPVKWIPNIQRPILLLHNTTDKMAKPEWQEELRKAGGGKVDYVEVVDPNPNRSPGEGHNYVGTEMDAARAVADWLKKKNFLPDNGQQAAK